MKRYRRKLKFVIREKASAFAYWLRGVREDVLFLFTTKHRREFLIGRGWSLLFFLLTACLLNPLIGFRRKINDYRAHERLSSAQQRLESARVKLFKRGQPYWQFDEPAKRRAIAEYTE